ncbi:glycosyltransferase family 4 protein [Mesorhizobium sp. M7A.F.Ca.MR.362.00.0.0]|uniref:glycosyltransferase family 4 protein n=1 Tax=Mesorhizobium sp. M7A.F.Ca.MR.362.00.0.0 TaxID=2496779 RepID=UPI000FD2CF68|nr:glycosyltransferase family 4 protein [Mesorhizobium sp. M7A.F.Ca.MR.362.00.0.0]RUU81993.1 glycosyltransferase [Mesorhizobium sp. M7A.F.Ca.MR.362.00.0.0]RWN96891.1 MAG: glycosyltransferase [Mesorhizobium sp.]
MNEVHLPRVLAIADRPGWAIDRKTQNLRRVLERRFEIVQRFQHDVTESDVNTADIVLIFYWLQISKLPLPESALARRSDRLLVGICSHRELEGEFREPGLAALHRLARAVFVNNRQFEHEYGPLLRVPVHYTPNGVDTTFFCPAQEPQPGSGELRVGWAGSLGNHGPAHRGFHDVIEPAVAAVPGARLLTAIREQRWRSHDEMPGFYRDLDVYVCASLSEGTPNPCLEAAACGVPLVTTRVGNMPELIRDGDNGLFFDGTAEGLANKLALLRDTPSLRSRMAARMIETIQEWDWGVQAENYARMFASLLTAGGAVGPMR